MDFVRTRNGVNLVLLRGKYIQKVRASKLEQTQTYVKPSKQSTAVTFKLII